MKANVQHADLDRVIQECTQEDLRFRKGRVGQEGHCFELFRRALEENDQDAWAALHRQYTPVVAGWISVTPS